MIAADSSTWVAFLSGENAPDTALLRTTLQNHQLSMIPAVLTELLSDSGLAPAAAKSLIALPLIELTPGFWERAGSLRAKVFRRGRRARLGDSLIAQTCLDASVSLITRDGDFRAFAQTSGLQLLP
jgi:predicted nucleic acid-binding protein